MDTSTRVPATQHDIFFVRLWINAVGKALVKKGILDKKDMTDELARVQLTMSPEMQPDISHMIKQTETW
jgi:hypothetical protein